MALLRVKPARAMTPSPPWARLSAMDADRLERLMLQVLEETRAFRQETNERFDEVRDELKVVDAKLDKLGVAVVDLRVRVEKLEGAAE